MNTPRRVHAVTVFSVCAALVLSAAATPVQTPTPELGPLPGKGLAQHPFLYCGEWQRRSISNQTMYIVRDGRIVWSYTNPQRGELGDCHRLRNGNILFSRQFGASEVTPDKKVVWALRDWTTLGPASSTQLLDEPGAAERGQLQR